MIKEVFIYGTGGHAKVIADMVQLDGSYVLAGFIDDFPKSESFCNKPVISFSQIPKQASVIVAIGDNFMRQKIVEKLLHSDLLFSFPSIIHPRACVSSDIFIGKGVVVMGNSAINPGAKIDDFAIINTSSSVDHDCHIGAFSSIAPGAILGGNVTIGALTAIGLGAKIIHSIKIGEESVIGAGSVVVKDFESFAVGHGIPCKKIRTRKKGEKYL